MKKNFELSSNSSTLNPLEELFKNQGTEAFECYKKVSNRYAKLHELSTNHLLNLSNLFSESREISQLFKQEGQKALDSYSNVVWDLNKILTNND